MDGVFSIALQFSLLADGIAPPVISNRISLAHLLTLCSLQVTHCSIYSFVYECIDGPHFHYRLLRRVLRLYSMPGAHIELSAPHTHHTPQKYHADTRD